MAIPTAGQGGDPTLIVCGPHSITFDPSGENKKVGFTTGDVSLQFNVSQRFTYANEFGQTPVTPQPQTVPAPLGSEAALQGRPPSPPPPTARR